MSTTEPATTPVLSVEQPEHRAAGGRPDAASRSAPGDGRGTRTMWVVGDSGRPQLSVGSLPDQIRVLTAAINARILPETYVHDSAPVVLETVSGAAGPTAGDDDVALPVRATTLRPPLLAALLARHVDVTAATGRAAGREISPAGALPAVLASRSWPDLPVLDRVISTPVLRPDGTLLQTPGYDAATGYYLAPTADIDPVPDIPTPEAVAAARSFLLDRFLCDFPWRGDADRANYLALLVSPIIRSFTRALSPFGVIDATMPGSGKTILTGCVGLMVGQRVLVWTDSDEELRKTITSVLADDGGVVVFDNLMEGTVIDSPTLARLVTDRTWTDRKLGTNTASTMTNDRLWLATGNNLRSGGDMASRSVWVRLDPNCPRPEARTGFAIPHLDTWILQADNRAAVLRHVLTLVLDWTAHGAPTSTRVPQMRQFTRWAQHLGGFCAHHDIGGFLTNTDTSRDLDDDAAEWRSFLLQWRTLFGDGEHNKVTAQQLRHSAETSGGLAGRDPWAGTFPLDGRGQLPSVKSLGRRLTGQLDRWRTDVVLRSVTDPRGHGRAYWVHTAT